MHCSSNTQQILLGVSSDCCSICEVVQKHDHLLLLVNKLANISHKLM